MHDCMIRHETQSLPGSAKCIVAEGITGAAVDCKTMYTEAGRKTCKSSFFEALSPYEKTKASLLNKNKLCKAMYNGSHISSILQSDVIGNADCVLFGEDQGQICNARDMERLGQIVNLYGTHFVEASSFGGEMKLELQMRKNRDAIGGWEAENSAANAALEQIQKPNPDIPLSNAEAPHPHKVTPQQREAAGIENEAVSFIGGDTLPPESAQVSHADVEAWSKSLERDPAMLPTTMSLRPITDLMRHPDIDIIVRQMAATEAEKVPENERDEVNKKELARLHNMVKRKEMLLRNHLRWFLAKSERLGTLEDRKIQTRTTTEQRLQQMRAIFREYASRVGAGTRNVQKKENSDSKGDGSDGEGGADAKFIELGGVTKRKHEKEIAADTNPDREDDPLSEPMARVALGFGDSVQATTREQAARTMLEYILAFRSASARYATTCASQCDIARSSALVRGQMYGKFRVLEKYRGDFPHGLSGDKDKMDLSDAGMFLKRSLQRCKRGCKTRGKEVETLAMSTESEQRITQRKHAGAKSFNAILAANDQNMDGFGIDADGIVAYDFSARSFFSGVRGVCQICSGLVTSLTVAATDKGSVDARQVCTQRLLFALDPKSMNSGEKKLMFDEKHGGMEDDPISQGESQSLETYGPGVCLGLVVHLEKNMMKEITMHGYQIPERPQLVQLLGVWRRHSASQLPTSIADTICHRFLRCDEISSLKKGPGGKEEAKDELEKKKAALVEKVQEKKKEVAELVTKLDDVQKTQKNMPKDAPKALVDAVAAKIKKLQKKKKIADAIVKAEVVEEKKETKEVAKVAKTETSQGAKCSFDCLMQTPWGKAYEKANPNHDALLEHGRDFEATVAHGNRPCGQFKELDKEKECSSCTK